MLLTSFRKGNKQPSPGLAAQGSPAQAPHGHSYPDRQTPAVLCFFLFFFPPLICRVLKISQENW